MPPDLRFSKYLNSDAVLGKDLGLYNLVVVGTGEYSLVVAINKFLGLLPYPRFISSFGHELAGCTFAGVLMTSEYRW